jgi:hypothetical protein
MRKQGFTIALIILGIGIPVAANSIGLSLAAAASFNADAGFVREVIAWMTMHPF